MWRQAELKGALGRTEANSGNLVKDRKFTELQVMRSKLGVDIARGGQDGERERKKVRVRERKRKVEKEEEEEGREGQKRKRMDGRGDRN